MESAWSVADGQWKSLFPEFDRTLDLPWTMGYVIRKRRQVDSLNELPKEKRPPEMMVWFGEPHEIDEWLDKVYEHRNSDNNKKPGEIVLPVNEDEIE